MLFLAFSALVISEFFSIKIGILKTLKSRRSVKLCVKSFFEEFFDGIDCLQTFLGFFERAVDFHQISLDCGYVFYQSPQNVLFFQYFLIRKGHYSVFKIVVCCSFFIFPESYDIYQYQESQGAVNGIFYSRELNKKTDIQLPKERQY